MTQKMAYIGFSFFAALFIASYFSFSISFILALTAAIVGVAALLFKKNKTFVSVCAFSAAAAFLWFCVYGIAVYSSVSSTNGKVINSIGTVTECTDYSSDITAYTVDTTINGANCKALVYGQSGHSVGERISFLGTAQIPENSYTFPALDYYRSKGVFLSFKDADVRHVSDGFSPRGVSYRYSSYIGSVFDKVLPGDEGKVMKSLVFGDSNALDDSILTSFGRSGIRHVISVSGFHLAVVTGLIFFLLKPLVKNKTARFVIAEVFIWCYVFLAELSPSVIRAVLMLTLFMAGELFARKSDILNSLGISLIILTVTMPFAARDPSVVLSAAGVLGIGVIGPFFAKNICIVFSKALTKLLRGAVISLVCSLVSFPFICIFFDEVSMVSVIGNLIIVPLCTFALICGVIVALTGGVMFIASPVLIAGGLSCKAALYLSDAIAKIPYSTISLGEDFTAVAAFLGTVAVILSWLIFKDRKMTAVVTALSLFILLLGKVSYSFINRDVLSITAFGGEYSSTVIQKGNKAVIIAGDGKRQTSAVEKYLISKGITSAEYIIIPDNPSHVASEYNLNLRRFEVSKVIVGEDAYLPDDVEILGASVSEMTDMGADINFEGCVISVRGDNVTVKYGDFAMLCAGDGEGKSYTVATVRDNYERALCSKALYPDFDEECAGYTVRCDKKSNVKVVQIENGNRQ